MTRELETPHPTMPPILKLSFKFFLSTWKSLYPESNSVIAGVEKSHNLIYILTQFFLVYVVILMQLSKTRIWQNTYFSSIFIFISLMLHPTSSKPQHTAGFSGSLTRAFFYANAASMPACWLWMGEEEEAKLLRTKVKISVLFSGPCTCCFCMHIAHT